MPSSHVPDHAIDGLPTDAEHRTDLDRRVLTFVVEARHLILLRRREFRRTTCHRRPALRNGQGLPGSSSDEVALELGEHAEDHTFRSGRLGRRRCRRSTRRHRAASASPSAGACGRPAKHWPMLESWLASTSSGYTRRSFYLAWHIKPHLVTPVGSSTPVTAAIAACCAASSRSSTSASNHSVLASR